MGGSAPELSARFPHQRGHLPPELLALEGRRFVFDVQLPKPMYFGRGPAEFTVLSVVEQNQPPVPRPSQRLPPSASVSTTPPRSVNTVSTSHSSPSHALSPSLAPTRPLPASPSVASASGSVSGFASPVHGPGTRNVMLAPSPSHAAYSNISYARPRDAFVPCPPASQSPDRLAGVSQTPVSSTKNDRKRSRKTTPRKAEAKSRHDGVSQSPVCSPKSDRKRSRKTTPRKVEAKSRERCHSSGSDEVHPFHAVRKTKNRPARSRDIEFSPVQSENSPDQPHSTRRRRLVTHSVEVSAPAGPDASIGDTCELDDPVSDQDGSPCHENFVSASLDEPHLDALDTQPSITEASTPSRAQRVRTPSRKAIESSAQESAKKKNTPKSSRKERAKKQLFTN
ncbi:unnamed protein product [Linum tenue]|uniref:Uncharacterized protein n=1 Tax=Linum tenue TaxID=586396 RepID=A0AAV0RT86_9ROSI|nr:unnamed protein product [Linum tenue]